MSLTNFPRLLGDIGGTHARFALQEAVNAPLTGVRTYRCADFPSLEAALRHFLRESGPIQPAACALGVAYAVCGDWVQMTNHSWAFSIQALRQSLQLPELRVLNDFTALALALPDLPPDELRPLGGEPGVPDAPLALIGAGTGLGVSGLFRLPNGTRHAIAGEGGHATLAPFDAEEAAVLDLLRPQFGHVSAERVLSGPGLVNLYRAAARLQGQEPAALEPAQVLERARSDGDPLCSTAVELFCGFLGSAAGSLALTLGAQGGVYIGGGIPPRLWPELQRSRFRERFEGKGRLRNYLAPIPCHLIVAETSPALLGAARALDQPAAG